MINYLAKPIIQRFKIEKFVETGVFMGDTMLIVQDWFCDMFGDEFNTGPWGQGKKGRYRMYEVEWSREYFENFIKPRHQNQINVECINSDSVAWLKSVIDSGELSNQDRCFFYLDAHAHGSPNPEPMRDEIRQVLRLRNQIICIDDWAVPGKNPDIYNTGMIWDLIKDRTDVIYYSDKHNFHGKWSCYIFIDRMSNELDELLQGLPLIKQML